MSPKDFTLGLIIRYGFELVGAAIIIAAGFAAAAWIGGLTDRWLGRRTTMEPPLRKILVRALRIVVLMFTLVLALDKFGFQIAPLVAGIGVAGLGVGIALQGVLSNVIAGLTIIFTKPFRVGEYVELLNVHGLVVNIELFSTTLVHPDRSRVIIPNRKIVGEILHNFGAVRQLNLSVGVAYGADLGQALTLIREVIQGNSRVLKDPEPIVGVAELADSAVTIAVRPWVPVADEVPAGAELYKAIAERLRAGGITIPFPQREVRLLAAS